nr:EOG090X06H8 [Cyclestheria hislopi]
MTAFLSGLRNESRDVAVSQLLHYLPLLRPANQEAARGYIRLLPRLLETFLEEDGNQISNNQNQQQSSEMQQLLTYALLHPALSIEEKRSLAQYVQQLNDKGGQEVPLSLIESDEQGIFDPLQPESDVFQTQQYVSQWDPWNSHSSVLVPPPYGGQNSRVRRSNSLTPPSNITYTSDLWSTQEDNGRIKPRSQSLSSTGDTCISSHSPLSPQNSEETTRPSSFHIPGSGMRDVPTWLKSLRLHKYAHLFSRLTYEEMLSLTEEQLELQGVTKGARHKIALSIQRLRERPALLAKLEKEVVETGGIQNALSELKTLLTTPIKPYQGPPCGEDGLFHSSLNGSTDNLAPRTDSVEVKLLGLGTLSLVTNHVSDMPTVIVSAPPDTDSGGEGSDSSGDDPVNDSGYSKFSDAFTGEVDVISMTASQEDLPGQVTRLLGKICTQLLVSPSPNEENVSHFITLLERCTTHEAFTQQQRRRIASWKEQVHRIWSSLPSLANGRSKTQDSRFARRWSNVAHYPGFCSDPGGQTSFGTQPNVYTLFPPRHHRGHDPYTFNHPHRTNMDESLSQTLSSRLGLQRARSAPMANNNGGNSNSNVSSNNSSLFNGERDRDTSDVDLNHRLESLCLSMTEHALEGANDT